MTFRIIFDASQQGIIRFGVTSGSLILAPGFRRLSGMIPVHERRDNCGASYAATRAIFDRSEQ